MMPIFAAIMVPMIVTVFNMFFVFRVELQLDAHVLDDGFQAHFRLAQHLHVDGVLERDHPLVRCFGNIPLLLGLAPPAT